MHYVKRCLKCKVVIEQCRCPSLEKNQLWDVCAKCRGACENNASN